jgi:ATP-dependent Clp protease adaptor protein ClpS
MAEDADNQERESNAGEGQAAVQDAPKTKPRAPKPRTLPPYKVLLHNDNRNDMEHVVRVICQLTALSTEEAIQRMLEAHNSGVALLLTTHKERAELYVEQFASCGLTVTAEPT